LINWNVVLRRVNLLYDEQIAILKNPDLSEMHRGLKTQSAKVPEEPADSWAKRRKGEAREAYTRRVGDAIVSIFYLSLGGAEEVYRQGLMSQEMAKVVTAAGRYRAEKGAWPEDMEALVPEYLKELPTDIYSGKNVLYARSEQGIRLYSIGQNRIDDGGFTGVRKDGKRADDLIVGVESE